jgi:hypothetical protein
MIHTAKLYPCICPDNYPTDLPRGRWDFYQLLYARIIPATIEKPVIGFTFAGLHHFRVHTTTSKKSAYDHCIAVRRLTRPLGDEGLKVCANICERMCGD